MFDFVSIIIRIKNHLDRAELSKRGMKTNTLSQLRQIQL